LGIREEKLSMGHARALITLDEVQTQLEVFHQVITENLSVREVEEIVRNIQNPSPAVEVTTKKTKSEKKSTEAEYEDLRHHLSKHFNSPVEFKRSEKGSGKIVISFKSDEDLERILSVLDAKTTA
jgi:ParB family transcriptional regulator, chromosome partitioning protein